MDKWPSCGRLSAPNEIYTDESSLVTISTSCFLASRHGPFSCRSYRVRLNTAFPRPWWLWVCTGI